MSDEPVKPPPGADATMSGQDFVRICTRFFGKSEGAYWKHRVARIFGVKWNTVWSYASGRRTIPRRIAEEVCEWNRIMDDVEALLASRTPDETSLDFCRLMDSVAAQVEKGSRHG
jgi:hypothetical protein